MHDFDDSMYLEYIEKKKQKMNDDPIDDRPIPQYISDLNAKALHESHIIYISSDEELEDKGADYVENLYSSDSDNSYYTAKTYFNSPKDTEQVIENSISRLDIGNSSGSIVPIEDITNNVIVIDDDSDSECNLPPIRRERVKKRRVSKNEAPNRNTVYTRRTKRNYNDDIIIATIHSEEYMVRCCECSQVTTRDIFDSLANLCYLRNDGRRFCLGCARLHAFASCKEEAADIITWFVTGKLPYYDQPINVDFSGIMNSLRTRRMFMEQRIARVGGDPSELVTTNELYQVCLDNNFRCALTGNKLYFNSGMYNRKPYWSLSLDHILPIKYYKTDPRTWSKYNLQLLAAVVNEIKGHVPDHELICWYAQLMNSKVIVL